MGEMELSPTAQQWMLVVLVWMGFGTLAGLLARSVLPGRQPEGAAGTVALGIIGSALGLLAVSLVAPGTHGGGTLNPIGPVGLLAATGATLVLLVLYRLVAALVAARAEPDIECYEDDEEGDEDEIFGQAA